MNYPHPLIAREGWPFLGITFVISCLVHFSAGFWWALPFWIVTVFILQFFRDPPRPVPQQDNAIVSPADGRVVSVGTVLDPYAQREALKISVFMNVFNVHSNRVPVNGVVENIHYFPGRFVNADLDKASLENERNALIIRRADGKRITCVQVAGLIARRILCYTRLNDILTRGERYGFIRFGSRVDVYLPVEARPCVAIGDKVSATTTILAELD